MTESNDIQMMSNGVVTGNSKMRKLGSGVEIIGSELRLNINTYCR